MKQSYFFALLTSRSQQVMTQLSKVPGPHNRCDFFRVKYMYIFRNISSISRFCVLNVTCDQTSKNFLLLILFPFTIAEYLIWSHRAEQNDSDSKFAVWCVLSRHAKCVRIRTTVLSALRERQKTHLSGSEQQRCTRTSGEEVIKILLFTAFLS